MSKRSKIAYFIFTIIFFSFVDVYFTNLILDNMYSLPQNSICDFIFIQNTGAAFSIFEGFKLFLIMFSLVAFCAIIFYTFKHIEKFKLIAVFFIGILSSGILINMAERIIFGYVRDFIKLNFINFPVFNISDIYINIGVIMLIILITIKKNSIKN